MKAMNIPCISTKNDHTLLNGIRLVLQAHILACDELLTWDKTNCQDKKQQKQKQTSKHTVLSLLFSSVS